MDKKQYLLSFILRFAAVGTLIQIMAGIVIGLSYPLFTIFNLNYVVDPEAFNFITILLIIDYVIILILLILLSTFVLQTKRYFMITASYLIISLLTRLTTAGVASGIVEDLTGLFVPFLIGLSNLLYILLLRRLRNEDIGGIMYSELQVGIVLHLIVIGFLNGLTQYLTTFIGIPLIFDSVIIIGGIFKGIAAFYMSTVYYRWSNMIDDNLTTTEEKIETWPTANM